MVTEHIIKIANELGVRLNQVESVYKLLDEGSTVPFIARYRKEMTGSLDEVAISAIRDRLAQLDELDKRREAIIASIKEQGKLTEKLHKQLLVAETMAKLEDIYLPYRPKRRTRATIAKEKGLEPLAEKLLEQTDLDITAEAAKYISKEKEVDTAEDALAGARDIIAEMINEDAEIREKMRKHYSEKGMFITKVLKDKEEEAVKYKDYYEWQEPVATAPSHRILAIRRGANEKMLSMRIEAPVEEAIEVIVSKYIAASNDSATQVKLAIADCYKRLLSLSMETEIRMETKKRADEEAIKVFADNLRELLLAAPLGQKRVMAIDPGFRTGCKLVTLDSQGQLLFDDVVYPHTGQAKADADGMKIMALCQKYDIEAIAIGNGTAGRETEGYLRKLGLPSSINIVMVNESGASVYSASEVAREEFPDKDLTVRGAVSIGRRLMDPLAELVKIDPKSIGVGQYQHDVDQKKLKNKLDDVVVSCVNSVGVDINTASKQLLTYVSGVGPTLAERIINYRNENGAFNSRESIKKVSGLGDKCFEQCAGFLRVRNSDNPLDISAVHPESYPIVNKMASDIGCNIEELIKNKALQDKIKLTDYVTETVGLPTLTDIKEELAKPGRDPREKFDAFSFAEGINEITDLNPGMKLPGIVTNVTAFGAFVDIGVHQDGLVHISELCDHFVSDPTEVTKVQQRVTVTVMEVDVPRKRIGLSMRTNADPSDLTTKKRVTGESKGNDRPQNNRPQNRKDNRGRNQEKPRRGGTGGTFGESLGLQIKL
ncbi:MAG: Tex family protein [Sedimentisphaeraceae bacterium JB056]